MDGTFGGVARALNSPVAMTAQIVTISEPTRFQSFRRQPTPMPGPQERLGTRTCCHRQLSVYRSAADADVHGLGVVRPIVRSLHRG